MATSFSYGPLSGPAPMKNRRRNPFWRFRRFFFVLAVLGGVALAVVWNFASRVELTEDDFDTLVATSYICTAEVQQGCNSDNATNEISVGGEDRVFVPYAEIPEVLINAVVATEDKSFFDHSGIDPVGLSRAAYAGVKNKITKSNGVIQGGSTITQQYIKLSSGDASRDFARKSREVVRAIKYEQLLGEEMAEELVAQYGSLDDLPEGISAKQAAKEDILERYLNRVWFGRRSYGVQSASQNYFGKDVQHLTLPEAAYLAGLIRNPPDAEYTADVTEATRRREVSLRLMTDEGYITEEERAAAHADTWPTITAGVVSKGLGDVTGSEYGTDYFVDIVQRRLNKIFPNGEHHGIGVRVYTTLDPEKQRVAHETITSRLDPNNIFMPLGSIVTLDERGRVVAMMGGADWAGTANNRSPQVNLAVGAETVGDGFQPGSTMKPIVLAEFIEQGFSPESFYDRRSIKLSGRTYPGYDNTWPNHRDVLNATTYSSNIVYMKIGQTVGNEQVVEMAHRLGITSTLEPVDSLPLGPENVSPLEMATVYSTFANEGVRYDPVVIDRIEDSEGNVLCWFPVEGTDCTGANPTGNATRQGEQVLDGSIARQVNTALRSVVTKGTGKKARLISEEDETERMVVGKTGTTNDYKDAWFTGFTCKYTTAVWMGYPNPSKPDRNYPVRDGVEMTAEEYEALLPTLTEKEKAQDKNRAEWFMSDFAEPRSSDLFGEEYEKVEGGSIPSEMWNSYMTAITAGDEPCEELPMESFDPGLRVIGQDLLTTIVPCAESDLPDPESDGGGDGSDEDAFGLLGDGETVTVGLRFQNDGNGNNGNRRRNNNNNNNNNNGDNNNGGNNDDNNNGGGRAVVPTTRPCIPIDNTGATLPWVSTTTTPEGTGTPTSDPGETSSTETTTVEPPTTPSSEPETTSSETTVPPDTEPTTVPAPDA